MKTTRSPLFYILRDRQPVPVDVFQYVEWVKDHGAETQLAKTQVGPHVVSTVFLSTNMYPHDPDRPILFETAIFGAAEGGVTIARRYATWDESMSGHKAIVESLGGTFR